MKAVSGPTRSLLIASIAARAAAKARGLTSAQSEEVENPPPAPAPAAHKRRALTYARVGQIRAVLRRFPAFQRPWLLRIGIYDELVTLLDGEVTPAELSIALRIWTRNVVYLKRVVKGKGRIGLDGEPSGDVPNEEHRKRAAAYLARRTAKNGGEIAPVVPARPIDAKELAAAFNEAKRRAQRKGGGS